MNKTKAFRVVVCVLMFCAASQAGAYMIFNVPNRIKNDSALVSGAHGNDSYIPLCSDIIKLFNIDTHARADSTNNPGLLCLLSDSHNIGNNESMLLLNVVSRFLYIFAAVIGLFIIFGQIRYDDAKRMFDIIISSLALLVLSPILLLCAVLIKLESKGPVLFKQTRVGINRRKRYNSQFQNWCRRNDSNLGKLFHVYKLRTMYENAEAKSGPIWAKKNDNRITRIGKILRKTHLDEIPQFYNVIMGDMSIIGPRPERPVFVNEHKKYFHGRYSVKPGITGLAQVRQSYAATLDETKRKLKYDKLYIKKQSITVDIAILLDTARRVVADKAAH